MVDTGNIACTEPVRILMGLHNGAAHLAAQLDSIAAQTHGNWHLQCSDDGSTDESTDIIAHFAKAHPGKVTLTKGPGTGFSDNYMQMIRALPARPGPVCFADQDDIWLPDKLARALDRLGSCRDMPALYCGRRWYWMPAQGRKVASPRMHRPFVLQNALIENVASGNTVMLNPMAARLARHAAARTGAVFAHDWWLYLLMTATGGQVCFDNGDPAILYRQHADNLIGAGQGIGQQFHRKIGVLQGKFADRVEMSLTNLHRIEDLLTPQARQICANFAKARQAKGLARLAGLHAVAPYRQHRGGTLGFWGAASLGRV